MTSVMDGDNKDLSVSSDNLACSNSVSLPVGWEADYDEESGKVFYVDHMRSVVCRLHATG